VPDGAGGVYVVWEEWRDRPFSTPYVQHITAAGDVSPGWPALGRRLTSVSADEFVVRATSDGTGGVIVAWEQLGASFVDVHAQRLDATGALLWGPEGVPVGVDPEEYLDNIMTDGGGGAYVSMFRYSGISPNREVTVIVQHLGANGAVAPGWPLGGLQPTTLTFAFPVSESLIPDGSGGVITLWADYSGETINMAQRLTANGTSLWTPGGIVLVSGTSIRASSDGQGGLLVAWGTYSGTPDIYAQRFDGAGTAMWGPGGSVVCDDPAYQYDPLICSDAAGGALVAWTDYRSGFGPAVFAMRMTSSGSNAPGWTDNGVPACPGCIDPYPAYTPATLASDSNGGAFMTWYNEVAWGLDVFMQHLDGLGGVENGWPRHATRVEEQPGTSTASPLLVEPDGSVVVALTQIDNDYDIDYEQYVQRMDATGQRMWGPSGVKLTHLDGDERRPSVVAGNAGASLEVWIDNPEMDRWDLQIGALTASGIANGYATVRSGIGPYIAFDVGSDGAAGALVAWQDARDGLNTGAIFVQRFSAAAVPQWTSDGVRVSGPYGGYSPQVVSDGSGGAIVVWIGDANTILAQRLDATGTPQWDPAGVVVGTGDGLYLDGCIPSDPDGAILFWESSVEVTPGTYGSLSKAQRVDGSGVVQWSPSRVRLSTDNVGQIYLVAVPDGASGAIFAWDDYRTAEDDIYAQRITAAGNVAPGWDPTGVVVADPPGFQVTPVIASDGVGGAIVAWQDYRGADADVYAQRLNASGAGQWTPNGIAVSAAAGAQVIQAISTDGASGAIVGWADGRGPYWNVRAQRLDPNGSALWTADGSTFDPVSGIQSNLSLASDGSSGVIAAWQDNRDRANDRVHSQRLFSNGGPAWGAGGVTSTLVSLVAADALPDRVRIRWWTSASSTIIRAERRHGEDAWRSVATLTADASGAIVLEDTDVAAGETYDYRLIVHQATGDQALGDVRVTTPRALAFALDGVRPNPAVGPVEVSFTLAGDGLATLEFLDVSGRRVVFRRLDIAPGAHRLSLPEASRLRPGIYVVRLTQNGKLILTA
jgi:hypothetical protein